jgi:hypothetical protein
MPVSLPVLYENSGVIKISYFRIENVNRLALMNPCLNVIYYFISGRAVTMATLLFH